MADWDEGAHPRDERGRFGAGSWAKRVAGKTMGAIRAGEGGFSERPREGAPLSGIMVSRDPKEGLGHVLELKDAATRFKTEAEFRAHVEAGVREWLSKAGPAVERLGKDHYFGGWFQKDPPSFHFDVSQRFPEDREEDAKRAGRERNQAAVWHVGRGEEIDTGGTGR